MPSPKSGLCDSLLLMSTTKPRAKARLEGRPATQATSNHEYCAAAPVYNDSPPNMV